MILGEVEETVTSSEIDDETYEEIIKVSLTPYHASRVDTRMSRDVDAYVLGAEGSMGKGALHILWSYRVPAQDPA